MIVDGYRFTIRRKGYHEGEAKIYPEHGGACVATGLVGENGGWGWSWSIDWPFEARGNGGYGGLPTRREALERMAGAVKRHQGAAPALN